MIIKEILNNIPYSIVTGSPDIEISGIKIDSRKIEPGDMFIAIKGRDSDGHDFIPMAIEKRASAILIDGERNNDFDKVDVSVFSVEETRDILSRLSNNFYKKPSDDFNLIGVTGTNGKTSVTVILNHVLTSLNHKTGLIGTIANYCGDKELDIARTTPTTPDCIELAQVMDLMKDGGVDDVIMEVSSMGLKTKRVKDLIFDIGIYTNISPEHLDDHKTMEDYQESKAMLFKQSKESVVNVDDDYADSIIQKSQGKVLKYGIYKKEKCDLYAENVVYSNEGVTFDMVYRDEKLNVELIIPSEFAVYNTLAVVGACLCMGIDFKIILEPIQDNVVVPGRYDIVSTDKGFTGIVDYAHTEIALENLLKAVKANPSYKRVISIFGCGGDRDPSKRQPMGRVSGEIADFTIITSDNPRTEDPLGIIKMVEEGIKSIESDYVVEPDRKEAIRMAIEMAQKGDAIVIAGKGHETYQILKNETIDFDDKEVFNSLI